MTEAFDKKIEELKEQEADARRRHFAFIEPLGGWHEKRPQLEAVQDNLHQVRMEMFGYTNSISEIPEPETPLRDGTVKE